MSQCIEILLVDDDLSDIHLVEEAFKSVTVSYHINIATDGIEALSFLRKEGKYKDVPEPNLVLLDLNMPRKNGYEVLKEVKEDINLKHIPIIILSTSNREVMEAYTIHANSYLKKPINYDVLVDMIKSIEHFWLKNAELPVH